MRTRKGPKREKTTRPPADIRKKRKESCEELEQRTEPFRQPPVEDTTKSTPIAANCLEKAVKRKPQADERKTEQKLFQKPTEKSRRHRHGRNKGAAAPAECPRNRTTCEPQEIPSQWRNSKVLSEPQAEKNEAKQPTAQTKTEEQIFPEPSEESTNPKAELKTEGLS